MKTVLVFLAKGFEEVEAITIVDYLKRADIEVNMVSVEKNIIVEGAHKIKINADILLEDLNDNELNKYDGFIIPGGLKSSISLKNNKTILNILQEANNKNKLIGAICAAPMVLFEAGLLKNKKATSYPGIFKNNELTKLNYIEKNVVIDNNIITSRGPALTVYFALSIIEYLINKETREQVESGILYNLTNEK